MSDDLTLVVNNTSISGWQTIRVTRGIERCPSDWDVSLTELFPGQADAVVVSPGDACQVKIGGDLVITGYVDKYNPSITPTDHTIRITGRGKCQDLVDCAAEWPNGQITESSALVIAQKLASAYGITVNAAQVDVGTPIPQQNVIRGESAYEIIERVCRWRGLLAYELPDGSLYLAQVGTTQAASGFTQGQNVQAASAEFSIDQRFSTYQCFSQSVATFAEEGWGGYAFYVAADNLVPRNRKRYIIAETGGWGEPICQQRAIWERNRRWGRSNALTLTTDSWRDSAGTLWTPNTLVPLSLPGLKVPQGVTWLIGDVTYHLNENGTTADLVIMPPEAFSPEPILLQPILPEFDPNWRP